MSDNHHTGRQRGESARASRVHRNQNRAVLVAALRVSNWPTRMHTLINKAKNVVATTDDSYIQQRFLLDTGRSRMIPCLPHRDLTHVVGNE
jgi:hypothetical protein